MFRFSSKLNSFLPAAFLLASGLAHADPFSTYSFIGTLATPISNQTSVTGQLTLDSLGDPSAFSFVSPVGLIDSSTYSVVFGGGIDPGGDQVEVLGFFEHNNSLTGITLSLAFLGDSTKGFSGGALFTGLLMTRAGDLPASYVNCIATDLACNPVAFSLFASGNASASSPIPEPASFFLFACSCVVVCRGYRKSLATIR